MHARNITTRSLTAIESHLLTTLSGSGRDIFTTRDAEAILQRPNAAVRKIMHRLVQRQWVKRIEKGKYLIVPISAGSDAHYTINELIIASRFIEPYYLTYATAISHYGLTEQPTRTVYIATSKRRLPAEMHGITYRFVTLQDRKFFGYTTVWVGDQKIQMADREKTLVDALDHPEFCGGLVEAAKAIWNSRDEVDWDRVMAYTKQMGSGAVIKRLGYLLELFDLAAPLKREQLRQKLSAGYILLDPSLLRAGRHLTRWRLQLNASDADLMDWRES